MYEVLRHLADNGVGDRAARHLRLLVDFRSEVLDEVRRGRRLISVMRGRAAEVVVLCYARNGLHIGKSNGPALPSAGSLPWFECSIWSFNGVPFFRFDIQHFSKIFNGIVPFFHARIYSPAEFMD